MQRIALDTLVFDVALWPRVIRDDDRIAHLADVLRAGKTLPPIKVEKSTKLVLGGWHTAAACRLVGEPTYFVEFVEVPESLRLIYAYNEDIAAALPYRDADVRSVARRLYDQRCTNGNAPNVVELARDLGRSRQTVDRWVEDKVAARERSIEVHRTARQIAVQAFRAIEISFQRIATLVGISKAQAVSDAHVSIADRLQDSEIVTEAYNVIHLAIGQGASVAEADAARDWLLEKTNPDELKQRERRRAWTAVSTELQTWAERTSALSLPTIVDPTFSDAIRHSVESIETFLQQVKGRIA